MLLQPRDTLLESAIDELLRHLTFTEVITLINISKVTVNSCETLFNIALAIKR